MQKTDDACDTVITVRDDAIGLLGYVVIDSLVRGSACGGMRVAEDLTLDEVRNLARGMTRKYMFILDGSIGGGKAGILLPHDATDEKKAALLKAFARRIRPFVISGIFFPLTDMNIREKDLRMFYSEMGVPLGRYVDTGFFTGVSVYNAYKSVCAYYGLEKPACAIEGMGSVGTALASFLAADNAKLVAVSTIRGAICNSDGLDIGELLRLQKEHGDDFVNQYSNAEKIPLGSLLTAKADFLFPCARPYSINESNWEEVKARFIVPGANDPVQKDIQEKLFSRGVIPLPDFVCNSGGIGGGYLEREGLGREEIVRIFERHFRPVVKALLSKSESTGRLPYDLAVEVIEQKREARVFRKSSLLRAGVKKAYFSMSERGLLPKGMRSSRARKTIIRNLEASLMKIAGLRQQNL